MADRESKSTEEAPGENKPDDATSKTDTKPKLLEILGDYVRKFTATTAGSISALGNPARFLLTFVAAILGAIVLLWIADKVVFFYLARSYINEIAGAFDLNEHLANALILLTFVAVLFFGRYIWSFSKQKRMIGIAGIAALLIGHSLALWYATRGVLVGGGGEYAKCYVLSRD